MPLSLFKNIYCVFNATSIQMAFFFLSCYLAHSKRTALVVYMNR